MGYLLFNKYIFVQNKILLLLYYYTHIHSYNYKIIFSYIYYLKIV